MFLFFLLCLLKCICSFSCLYKCIYSFSLFWHIVCFLLSCSFSPCLRKSFVSHYVYMCAFVLSYQAADMKQGLDLKELVIFRYYLLLWNTSVMIMLWLETKFKVGGWLFTGNWLLCFTVIAGLLFLRLQSQKP